MNYASLGLCLSLAACGGGGAGSPALPAPTPIQPARPLLVAVVGDSISKLQVLPDSPVPCGAGFTAACDYSSDGSHSWPTLLAAQTGDTVVNLASPGARTLEPFPGTTAVIVQVASIPTNADVVVWESGTNDTSAHGISSAYNDAVTQMTTAIHAQAKGAKLIIVGVRYYHGSTTARVDAWDTLEQEAGATFIDTRSVWASDFSADWPDGVHPGPAAVAKIEQLVAAQL